MPLRHIISVDDFSAEDLERLFKRALEHKHHPASEPRRDLSRATVVNLFYEPSTRTRLSFEFAARELGCRVTSTENAKEFSSGAKGENLKDTLATVSRYCAACGGGVIVVRHHLGGELTEATRASLVPVINAGDGANEHPTQALLDFFTLVEAARVRRIPRAGLNVHFFGDNAQARTARSLLRLLVRHAKSFDLTIKGLYAGGPWKDREHFAPELVREAERYGYEIMQGRPLGSVDAHVVYLNRKQKERGPQSAEGAVEGEPAFRFTSADARRLPEEAIIMHPLPRVNELADEVDADHRAAYFTMQVPNGLYVRMALLEFLLDAM